MSSEPEQTATQRRNLMVLGVAGGLGIAAIVVLLATLLLTGTAAAASAGEIVKVSTMGSCTDTQYKDQGRAHTENLKEAIARNSYPPTSGKHYVDPARWGNYPTPIAQIQGVHNLEHGGIVIQYGPQVSSGDQDKLFAYYDSDPNGILMAPLPKLGSEIAATAWTHLLKCSKFDKKALDSFKKKYRYHGPEAIPKENLAPGM